MPRKREYADDAARAKAYRERQAAETVRLDPQLLTDLLTAVEEAAKAGDPLATTVRTGTGESLLRNLRLHFVRRAAELRQAALPKPGELIHVRDAGGTRVLVDLVRIEGEQATVRGLGQRRDQTWTVRLEQIEP